LEMDYLKYAVLKTISHRNLEMFLRTSNEYLMNIRLVVIDDSITPVNKFSGEILSFNQLSSGEKQILYIFSQIYLLHKKDIFILFDEPELSLSLTWQRKILPDIVNSGKCAFLFVITHSPFVFDNGLEQYAQGINMYFRNYELAR
jgi:predicted ATPase